MKEKTKKVRYLGGYLQESHCLTTYRTYEVETEIVQDRELFYTLKDEHGVFPAYYFKPVYADAIFLAYTTQQTPLVGEPIKLRRLDPYTKEFKRVEKVVPQRTYYIGNGIYEVVTSEMETLVLQTSETKWRSDAEELVFVGIAEEFTDNINIYDCYEGFWGTTKVSKAYTLRTSKVQEMQHVGNGVYSIQTANSLYIVFR